MKIFCQVECLVIAVDLLKVVLRYLRHKTSFFVSLKRQKIRWIACYIILLLMKERFKRWYLKHKVICLFALILSKKLSELFLVEQRADDSCNLLIRILIVIYILTKQ